MSILESAKYLKAGLDPNKRFVYTKDSHTVLAAGAVLKEAVHLGIDVGIDALVNVTIDRNPIYLAAERAGARAFKVPVIRRGVAYMSTKLGVDIGANPVRWVKDQTVSVIKDGWIQLVDLGFELSGLDDYTIDVTATAHEVQLVFDDLAGAMAGRTVLRMEQARGGARWDVSTQVREPTTSRAQSGYRSQRDRLFQSFLEKIEQGDQVF